MSVRKLSKVQILASDIMKMCRTVLKPPVALALPTQSTLLRGVCRIEYKKASYLLSDAIDAKTKLRMSDKPVVDLPANSRKAR